MEILHSSASESSESNSFVSKWQHCSRGAFQGWFLWFSRRPYLREHQFALPDSPKYEPAHFHQPERVEQSSQSKHHLQRAAKENENCAFQAWNNTELSENRNKNAFLFPETDHMQILLWFFGFCSLCCPSWPTWGCIILNQLHIKPIKNVAPSHDFSPIPRFPLPAQPRVLPFQFSAV